MHETLYAHGEAMPGSQKKLPYEGNKDYKNIILKKPDLGLIRLKLSKAENADCVGFSGSFFRYFFRRCAVTAGSSFCSSVLMGF